MTCTNRPDACDPGCPGWFVNDESGTIERCDECERFILDEHAACHAHTCAVCSRELIAQNTQLAVDLDAWHELAKGANKLPRSNRPQTAAPYALSAYTDREDLASWLAQVDPNGTFTDNQREALDEDPLTLDELWENVGYVIAAAE